jgi:hypothetical protein
MSARLIEIYKLDDRVEVLFADEAGDTWRPGVVRGLDHPGVWVQTEDRRLWFVTNGRRIRPTTPALSAVSASSA